MLKEDRKELSEMAKKMKMTGMKIERGRNFGKIYSGLYNGKNYPTNVLYVL